MLFGYVGLVRRKQDMQIFCVLTKVLLLYPEIFVNEIDACRTELSYVNMVYDMGYEENNG
jgi:hypothetical protein